MFYALRPPLRPDTRVDWLPVAGAQRGPAPTCPLCGRFIGAKPLLPPVQIEIAAGKLEEADFVLGVGDEILISNVLLAKIRDAGLVGIDASHLADIVAIGRNRVRDAVRGHSVALVHRGTYLDERHSGLRRSPGGICNNCRQGGNIIQVSGVVVDQDRWDGSDIFRPWGLPGIVVVSGKFADLARSLGSVDVIPAGEVSIDYR